VESNPSPAGSCSLPFQVSHDPASDEILNILKSNSPDTVTIVAIGPMTNCAVAAAKDPESFLRCKEIIYMGGAVNVPGNTTPVAEANVYADAYAAAFVFALTSPDPASTFPSSPPCSHCQAPGGSFHLEDHRGVVSKRRLRLTLFPLDITTRHVLRRDEFEQAIARDLAEGSPLAKWLSICVQALFDKIACQKNGRIPTQDQDPGQHKQDTGNRGSDTIQLHDPLCIWYALTSETLKWTPAVATTHGGVLEDIRVETRGEWAKGQLVVDRRMRSKQAAPAKLIESIMEPNNLAASAESARNKVTWLVEGQGNQVRRIVESPGVNTFGTHLLRVIMGQGYSFP
jgi:inosine-uridine nucleoside N-ribohydrolase